MPRSVKEWFGKTDNSMPTDKVRQRILERENSTCHICGGKIDKPGWHADHVPPLKDGGQNRESMIKPAHAKCHQLLTARQAIERAPIERMKKKHSGAFRPKSKLASKEPKPKWADPFNLPKKRLFMEAKS